MRVGPWYGTVKVYRRARGATYDSVSSMVADTKLRGRFAPLHFRRSSLFVRQTSRRFSRIYQLREDNVKQRGPS
jgi:hypothetical protein